MKQLQVELTPRAQNLLLETIQWYNKQRKGQGTKFYNEVIASFETIAKNPDAFQFRYKDVRVSPLKKHPYLVFYSIRQSTAYILAVLHSSQNPENWPKKPLA